ncbi:hypothetical protein GIB67_007797 [Kingdonia uniflora]|uniref:Uncharacterized protein n=1 Tax=Kingdonia uniflora TaxID=39325 RepID=A0A7J7N200_9MAGN|nr:hypothetical protein GIB67_007797 [Kingdonia uniflora]
MEGLIPFVYKAIVQFKSGVPMTTGSRFKESPSASYIRLAGESGRFQSSEIQLFLSSSTSSSVSQLHVPNTTQSPLHRSSIRQLGSS